ncbi:MAG: hypothetical protein ACPG4N_06835 [Gammaproteobacteria bacterium]
MAQVTGPDSQTFTFPGDGFQGGDFNDRELMPPVPADAQPLNEQYLSQLNSPPRQQGSEFVDNQMGSAPRGSGLPRTPYPDYPGASYDYSDIQSGGYRDYQRPPQQQMAPPDRMGADRMGAPLSRAPMNPNTPAPYSRQPAPVRGMQSIIGRQEPGREGNNQLLDMDPGELLPPELAKRRTSIQRQARRENHALLGELMAAEDALEDIAAAERPAPEAVGEAYSRIFDIQRRMIELRVRTQNELSDIWDEAKHTGPIDAPPSPLVDGLPGSAPKAQGMAQ